MGGRVSGRWLHGGACDRVGIAIAERGTHIPWIVGCSIANHRTEPGTCSRNLTVVLNTHGHKTQTETSGTNTPQGEQEMVGAMQGFPGVGHEGWTRASRWQHAGATGRSVPRKVTGIRDLQHSRNEAKPDNISANLLDFLLDYTHGHVYWQTGLALGAGQVSHLMDEPMLPRCQPRSPL